MIAELSLALDLPGLLAATTEGGFLSGLFGTVMLWLKVALGIGLVIFVHELGHFVAAKSFGVKCEKFYVGFDVPISIGPIKFPRTLGKFTYGETEYGIGVVPLGGYVKMLGQDDDPRKLEEENKRIQIARENGEAYQEPQLDPRSFPAKPVWQRMIIISAGVVVNVVTGILFAALAFGFGVGYKPAVVGGVVPGGAAWQAGVQPGGQVVSIGDFQDDKMPFREMRTEVLTLGMKGDQAIPVSIRYPDQARNYQLTPQSLPADENLRVIGIAVPNSLTIATNQPAIPGSVADQVMTDQYAGSTVIAYDGNPVPEGDLIPSTGFFDYLHTHPSDPIELTLRREDNSERQVTLPPQMSKSLGFRPTIGPVSALVQGGPAERAGMRVGDVITAADGNDQIDALTLATQYVGATDTTSLTVDRDGETIRIDVQPGSMPQTMSPINLMSDEIGINRLGLAYRFSSKVGHVTTPNDQGLRVGDRIKSVRLLSPADKSFPDVDAERSAQLREGQELSKLYTLSTFLEELQIFPTGTQFEIHALREASKDVGDDDSQTDQPTSEIVVTKTLTVIQDTVARFDRGLNFLPSEQLRRAEGFGDAVTLGLNEGKRRLYDVVRFLAMLPQGQVKLRHVGGPLAIVGVAKGETEKGISSQLLFLTMLSMNLAILNFLPIPALDGGHMVFLVYELVAGKRANEQLEFRLTVAGLLSLLALMVVVFANDVMRFLN